MYTYISLDTVEQHLRMEVVDLDVLDAKEPRRIGRDSRHGLLSLLVGSATVYDDRTSVIRRLTSTGGRAVVRLVGGANFATRHPKPWTFAYDTAQGTQRPWNECDIWLAPAAQGLMWRRGMSWCSSLSRPSLTNTRSRVSLSLVAGVFM
jgi:hypothetical protein